MTKPVRHPDRSVLLDLFEYEPETGHLRWKIRPAQKSRRDIGDLAGSRAKYGSIQVTIKGRQYRAHRLIWKMVHDEEPPEIDHIDGDPSNNRLTNLRAADRSGNSRNRRLSKSNRWGLKGVKREDLGFTAIVHVDGKPRRIGRFATPEEAHAAYVEGAREHYGEFANDGVRPLLPVPGLKPVERDVG